MAKPLRVMLVGGGTGGHIVPNFAVATALKARFSQLKLCYVGSRNALDRELVESQNISFYGLFSGKLRRYVSWRYLVDPFLLLIGLFQSFFILLRIRPHVVFSKGSYVSVPIAFAAFLLRYPVVLHESDAVMGVANRLNARFAKKVCVSFQSKNTSSKIIYTGNPVRKELLEGEAKTGYQITGFSKKMPVILIFGGSQGALQINQMVRDGFDDLVTHFQVIHITGKGKGLGLKHQNYRAFEYVTGDLKHLYAITSIIVSRAGANSLSEIALLNIPNILIPLKNADQLANAKSFEVVGASHVLEENEDLLSVLLDLHQGTDRQKKMKQALEKLSQPEATEKIVDVIEDVLD